MSTTQSIQLLGLFSQLRCIGLGVLIGRPKDITTFFNAIVFCIGIWGLNQGLRFELNASVRRKFLLFLIYASMFLHHVFYFYGEVFTSIWVGVNGVAFGSRGLDFCIENNAALEQLCWYTPEFSVLWHPFVNFSSSLPFQHRWLVYFLLWGWALVYGVINAPLYTNIFQSIATYIKLEWLQKK